MVYDEKPDEPLLLMLGMGTPFLFAPYVKEMEAYTNVTPMYEISEVQ